jgi:hypothetical protein
MGGPVKGSALFFDADIIAGGIDLRRASYAGRMQDRILRRIAQDAGVPRLETVLAELPAADLQSLLLRVFQTRARTMPLRSVLERAGSSMLSSPSSVDARLLHTFDRMAFATADNFEAVDLAPVCPSGATYALGGIDQNNLLTTIRNAEVLGDSTPAMAIECARRRKKTTDRSVMPPVRLCASQRVVRLQPFDMPGFTPHFRLFALVSAGRDTGSHNFEFPHLREHIGFYLRLCRALGDEGFQMANPRVEISDLGLTEILLAIAGVCRDEVRGMVRAHIHDGSKRFLESRGIVLPEDIVDPAKELTGPPPVEEGLERLVRLKQRVIDPLLMEYPEADFRFNLARLEGLGYYTGLCLRISPLAPDGARYAVIDGGFTDWTARLLDDRKERLLTSGIGSEFACRKYRL